MAVFENRQPVTAAKFINKSSLFILLLGFIRRLELKPNSNQKVENIFVAPPYCQTECCLLPYFSSEAMSNDVVEILFDASSFQHDVDIVIEVPQRGRAVQFGRFNQGGEIDIFNE